MPVTAQAVLKHSARLIVGLGLAYGGLGLDSSAAVAQRGPGGGGRGAAAAPAVTITDVKIARMNERIAAVGSARARQQVTLTTRVAGVISEVLFEGGQLVEANQPLVKLNAEPEAIAVETAEAQRRRRPTRSSATSNSTRAPSRALPSPRRIRRSRWPMPRCAAPATTSTA